MPCSGDYMNQTNEELEHGRLMLVHDEVFINKRITPKAWADAGYDRRVYGHPLTAAKRDNLVKALCLAAQQHGKALLDGLTLEAQMWFRDHAVADAERQRREKHQNWSA